MTMGFSEHQLSRRDLAGLASAAGLAATAATGAELLGAGPAGAVHLDPDGDRGRLRLRRDPGSVVSAIDVPIEPSPTVARGSTTRTPVLRTTGFSVAGVTWRRGSAEVRARFRREDGGWTGWQQLPPLHDRADEGRRQEGHRTPEATEAVWAGRCDAIQLEIAGDPQEPVLALIDPGRRDADDAVLLDDEALDREELLRADGGVPRPGMRTRADWGANPDLRSGTPIINRTIQQVHVHHTVNSNSYSRSDVPGMIRAMYRYHTRSLGWSDIGYNFLVDRFGRIWIGRAGGARRPVRGAHTLGFNNTSTGVAAIGNFESGRPTDAMIRAIVRLAAWKLHRYDRRPRGTVRVYSHGSDKYPPGTWVTLPTIDGHRHTNDTACPGQHLFEALPRIRRLAARRIERFTG